MVRLHFYCGHPYAERFLSLLSAFLSPPSPLPTLTGNYETFLEAKSARLASMDAQRGADLKKLQRELEWMRKQPKARQAKSKAREGAFHELVKKTTKGPVRLNGFNQGVRL
jgi:ATPase subunit of ABC transporter with duplicated ATPase domains